MNVTAAELEAGHWNVDLLGDVPPSIYSDFPVEINKFVDDYANLKLSLTYLKNLGENDSVVLKVIDIFADSEVAEYNISEYMMYTDALSADKDYALVLTETIDGETTEYYKEVSVQNVQAEMPDYITNAPDDCERTILIGNIEDLKASERVDENGEKYIDGTMQRYTKVNAIDFTSYRSTLSSDAIYRIFTKDDNGERYTGFISTYEGDSDLGIYTPDIIVRTWESYMSPAAFTLPSGGITASMIQSATKINMTNYRDYSYTIRDTKSPIKVIAWQVPDGAQTTQNRWKITGHSDQSVAMEIWTASSLTSTPTKCTTRGASQTVNITFIPDGYTGVDDGDYIFFVLYMPNKTLGHGMFGIEPVDEYPSGDVSGLAYAAYQAGGADRLYSTQYTLYDSRDTDTFYVNYTEATPVNYRATLTNVVSSGAATSKTMEISYYLDQTSYFSLLQDPDDIVTAPWGTEDSISSRRARYIFQVSADRQAFISIQDVEETTESSYYTLSYSQYN